MASKLNNKNLTQKAMLDEQIFDQNLQRKVVSDKNRTLYNKVTKK